MLSAHRQTQTYGSIQCLSRPPSPSWRPLYLSILSLSLLRLFWLTVTVWCVVDDDIAVGCCYSVDRPHLLNALGFAGSSRLEGDERNTQQRATLTRRHRLLPCLPLWHSQSGRRRVGLRACNIITLWGEGGWGGDCSPQTTTKYIHTRSNHRHRPRCCVLFLYDDNT